MQDSCHFCHVLASQGHSVPCLQCKAQKFAEKMIAWRDKMDGDLEQGVMSGYAIQEEIRRASMTRQEQLMKELYNNDKIFFDSVNRGISDQMDAFRYLAPPDLPIIRKTENWQTFKVPYEPSAPAITCECAKEKFNFMFHERWCPDYVHPFAAAEVKQAEVKRETYMTPGDWVGGARE